MEVSDTFIGQHSGEGKGYSQFYPGTRAIVLEWRYDKVMAVNPLLGLR